MTLRADHAERDHERDSAPVMPPATAAMMIALSKMFILSIHPVENFAMRSLSRRRVQRVAAIPGASDREQKVLDE